MPTYYNTLDNFMNIINLGRLSEMAWTELLVLFKSMQVSSHCVQGGFER